MLARVRLALSGLEGVRRLRVEAADTGALESLGGRALCGVEKPLTILP